MAYKSKADQAKAARRHYLKNRDVMISRTKISNAKARKRNKAYIQEFLKTQSCKDCGESDPIVLEFDHIGDKRANVADLSHSGYSLKVIEKEIAKCEIRCANCHRRKTFKERGYSGSRI